jgi:hypothetical protein
MFINGLWFIEQAWETVVKPFTMRIFEVIWILFKRQGPENGTFLFCYAVCLSGSLALAF